MQILVFSKQGLSDEEKYLKIGRRIFESEVPKMKRTLAVLILSLSLLTGSVSAFSDVDEGLYYAAPIAWAVERGITTGTTEDTFSPDALCTQGQILTFLWRAAGSPEAETENPDTSSSLNPDFLKAIRWAYEAGILEGKTASGVLYFDPSAPCDRGTAMGFLWRYAGSPAASAPGAFTDVSPSADYAQAVAWAVEQGITSGTAEATFSPGEACTRGQIATFLYRCLNETCQPEHFQTPVEVDIPLEQPSQEPEEDVRPLRTLTGQGKAYSLGLDGSEFTSDGVYPASVTVDIYSSYEAVFTVKVPFPLFQACSYSVRFDDPEKPGAGYMFTRLRWDEAFADIIPWEGEHQDYRFSDTSGDLTEPVFEAQEEEDNRMDGVVSWRMKFAETKGGFTYERLEDYQLSCEVSYNL